MVEFDRRTFLRGLGCAAAYQVLKPLELFAQDAPTIEELVTSFPEHIPGIAEVAKYPVDGAVEVVVYIEQRDIENQPITEESVQPILATQNGIRRALPFLLTHHPRYFFFNFK